MLKGFASNLFYLVLKSVDRLNDLTLEGYVVHPNYLSVITDEMYRSSEELSFIRKEIATELKEGIYLDNEDFLCNLNTYFALAFGDKYKEDTLYQIIFKAYTELRSAIKEE